MTFDPSICMLQWRELGAVWTAIALGFVGGWLWAVLRSRYRHDHHARAADEVQISQVRHGR